MPSPDSDRFHAMKPFTVSRALDIEQGETLGLALLEYVDTGGDDSPGVIFDVQYEHDRVEFRSPGQKDAVAFGRGKLEHDRDWRDCRILFSQYHNTASIRGLTFDAPVKIASMTKAEFRDMQKIFQGPRGLKEPINEATMTASKDSSPWGRHAVSPEAKELVAKAEANAASERATKRHPMRLRDYMIIGGAVLGLIGIPAILISFFV